MISLLRRSLRLAVYGASPPSGKTGFIRNDTMMALLSDQLCYAKEAGGWRIAGVVGGAGGGEQ